MDFAETKKLAMQANGEVWKYLTQADLGADERVQMLCSAYASLYLWAAAGGTALNFARGHWLISRVLCVLKQEDLADHHSKLCKTYTDLATDRKDFDDFYAIEALARAAALKRDTDHAKKLKSQAAQLAAGIENAEDRKIAEGDLAAEPWFGL